MTLSIDQRLRAESRRKYRPIKRIGDLLLCVAVAIGLLPVMAACALAIRLDSPGPILFVQERIGKGGRPFRMYKFRSMRADVNDSSHRVFLKAFVRGDLSVEAAGAEAPVPVAAGTTGRSVAPAPVRALGRSRVSRSSDWRHASIRHGAVGDGGPEGVLYKPAQISQITRVGRVLRKTGLDELPQLLNVLKGEMSLVGPRPNVRWEFEEYKLWHSERLDVLPGITGLAQVNGRSSIRFDQIIRYDIEYAEGQSALLDLQILWRTLVVALRREGSA